MQMPNRDLPVSRVQVLAPNVEVAFTEAALVAEVLGVSPGPVDALDVATRVQAGPITALGRGLIAAAIRWLAYPLLPHGLSAPHSSATPA